MLGKTSESDLSGRLYDLIFELNLIAPSVLFAVLPQLDFKLKVEADPISDQAFEPNCVHCRRINPRKFNVLQSNEEDERKAVTKLLSKMFADPDSELAAQNQPLWKCYLGR